MPVSTKTEKVSQEENGRDSASKLPVSSLPCDQVVDGSIVPLTGSAYCPVGTFMRKKPLGSATAHTKVSRMYVGTRCTVEVGSTTLKADAISGCINRSIVSRMREV